jgi:hypothetical protein
MFLGVLVEKPGDNCEKHTQKLLKKKDNPFEIMRWRSVLLSAQPWI